MLDDILALRPVDSIDGAVQLMTAIDDFLPDADGLKWFNRLYLKVTLAVRTAVVTDAFFNDPDFIHGLDVAFANLYFDAAAAGNGDALNAPPAWRPLFEARNRSGIARLQFALAGMNAHINRDLPVGIVETFRLLGGGPVTNGPRHDDFERVNDILESVESQVKKEFATGLIGDVDVIAGRLDDVVAIWSVRTAREAAWTNAKVLSTLQASVFLQDSFFSGLDRFTGFAGRGLLLPIA
jgi:hypothetical protein